MIHSDPDPLTLSEQLRTAIADGNRPLALKLNEDIRHRVAAMQADLDAAGRKRVELNEQIDELYRTRNAE